MKCLSWFGAVSLLTCSCTPAVPLDRAIIGTWEVWCRTESRNDTECLGKEDHGLYRTFEKDGRFTTGSTNTGTSMNGTWTLHGNEVRTRMEGAGLTIEERYEARIVDDRLVLWTADKGFGAVLGRQGRAFEAAASPKQSRGGKTEHSIDGLAYALDLPAGYRLIDNRSTRQAWGPASEGLTVELAVSPRSQHQVGGRWVPVPCTEYGGGEVGSSGEFDGVQREVDVGWIRCLEGTDKSLMCAASHTRGYLLPDEIGNARALCDGFTTAP